MKLSRRTFLIATGGAITVGFAAERATVWARRRPVLEWTASVAGAPTVGDLGIEYLTRTSSEDDWDVLLSQLSGLVHPASLLRGPERTAAGFNDRVRRDFRDGDILRMGGWLLSRTELRLCALVALEITERTGAVGIFSPRRLATGEDLFWTAPKAHFVLPSSATSLEFQFRSGAPGPQRVAVRINGQTIDELPAEHAWLRARYPTKSSGESTFAVDLLTTPEWKPRNDFRTLGVGLDRLHHL
jgi:hypothetical protein